MKTLLPILALIYSFGLSINASAKVAADESNFAAAAFEPSALRVYYVDYYASHLKFPSSIETLGLNPSDFQTENIDGITINKSNGAILVELSHIFGEKQWLSLIPVTNNIGSIDSFICQTTVNAEIVGDLDCRSGVPYESVDTIVDSSFFLNTLIAAASIRLDFNEHVQSQGVFPTDVSQFGINDAWLENANINNVIVNPESGAILFALSSAFGTNQWLALVPQLEDPFYIRSWSCLTTIDSEISHSFCSSDLPLNRILP